jgi:hypothetical protein
VLESKQKILILSDGNHPDIGAIKNTLQLQQSFDVSVFTSEPYPNDLSEFNLLILNQLPSSSKSAADILDKAKNNRLPVLFIVGNKTFLPQLNALNSGITITPLAGSGEEAQPVYNFNFSTFNLSEDFIEMAPKLPPLQVPFADYELNAEITPLFYQKLKSIETGKPLIATGTDSGRKTGFIVGEGIWRWRLFDYYSHQNHNRFNELINQLVQYMALRENEDNFILDFKPVYSEIEEVAINAEVYNDAFERASSAEVSIVLKNNNNEDFSFIFDADGDDYSLNAGNLPKGDYFFQAEAKIGNDTFTEEGSFTVIPVNVERIETQASHNLLYQLSAQSGAEFYLPYQSSELIATLKNSNQLKASVYYQEMVDELLNLKWLVFVFIGLLGMEWFLRKYWGIY